MAGEGNPLWACCARPKGHLGGWVGVEIARLRHFSLLWTGQQFSFPGRLRPVIPAYSSLSPVADDREEGEPLLLAPYSPHLAPRPDSPQLLGLGCRGCHHPGSTRLCRPHPSSASWLLPLARDLQLSMGLTSVGSRSEQSGASPTGWNWKVRPTVREGKSAVGLSPIPCSENYDWREDNNCPI